MLRARSIAQWGVLALVAGVSFALGTLNPMIGTRAEAQSRAASNTDDPAPIITYQGRYVNYVVPKDKKDPILEVLPFPNAPVFLTRTKKGVSAYERRDGVLNLLLDVKIEEASYKGITFLEDSRTFIIHHEANARVYSIDRNVTYPKPRNN